MRRTMGNIVIHGRDTSAPVETSLTSDFQHTEGLRTLACKQQPKACTRPEPGKLVAHIRRWNRTRSHRELCHGTSSEQAARDRLWDTRFPLDAGRAAEAPGVRTTMTLTVDKDSETRRTYGPVHNGRGEPSPSDGPCDF